MNLPKEACSVVLIGPRSKISDELRPFAALVASWEFIDGAITISVFDGLLLENLDCNPVRCIGCFAQVDRQALKGALDGATLLNVIRELVEISLEAVLTISCQQSSTRKDATSPYIACCVTAVASSPPRLKFTIALSRLNLLLATFSVALQRLLTHSRSSCPSSHCAHRRLRNRQCCRSRLRREQAGVVWPSRGRRSPRTFCSLGCSDMVHVRNCCKSRGISYGAGNLASNSDNYQD